MTTTLATGSNAAGRRAAFTLIELSIAVFIVATLMAVSLPYFVRSYNSSQLNSSARSFMTLCQFARMQAVLRQQQTTVHIDLDRQMCWVSQALRSDALIDEPQVLHVQEIPQRVALVSVERVGELAAKSGRVELFFYRNGTCDEFSVTFRGRERRSGIAVDLDPVTARATAYAVKL